MYLKHTAAILGITGSLILGQFTVYAQASEVNDFITVNVRESSTIIGESEAKNIAFRDAGISEVDVRSIKVEKDNENGNVIFEIEFFTDNYKYDYDIKESDASIIEKEKEALSHPTGGSQSDIISLDSAKAIALKDAGLSVGQVSFIKTEKDHENGRIVYEIEFLSGNEKFEYEIDGATGIIYKWEWRINNRDNSVSGNTPGNESNTTITISRTMIKGEELDLSEDVFNRLATEPARYESSNSKVAKIDSDDDELKAKRKGTATITAYSKDNNVVGVLEVTVIGKTKLKFKKVSSNTIEKIDASKCFKNSAAANVSIKYWSSSNTNVAVIDPSSGMITIKGKGKTKITAHLYDNNKKITGKLSVR